MHPFFSDNKNLNLNDSPRKISPYKQSKLTPNYYYKKIQDEKSNRKNSDNNPNNSNNDNRVPQKIKDHLINHLMNIDSKSNFIDVRKEKEKEKEKEVDDIHNISSSGKKFSEKNSNILDYLAKK